MTKVLRIINRFNLGGPTYNVAYLSKYMEPEFETLLVGGAIDESEASSDYIIKKLGLNPVVIPEMKREINGKLDLIAYRKIKKLIKEFKPDIVHTHASKAGFLGRYAAINCNVPIIIHTFHGHIFHSYFNRYKTMIFKGLERNLARKTSAIIAISNLQLQELCYEHRIAPYDKFRVIPLGFDLERFQDSYSLKRESFRKEYNLDDDEVAVSIIGRLVPVKNHPLFINALAKAKKNSAIKLRAFIVGDGNLIGDLQGLANQLGLSCTTIENKKQKADITFTSWIKDADYVFAGSDIVALTSYNEGTPVSLIEAQATNKPIVSTKVGGIEDVVISGTTALLSENDNLDAFADNLTLLVNNKELREDMSRAGYEFVKNKFHYTRLVADMKDLYNQLLK
ncbi:MAG: glycosyltransferase [Bacteroidales bacterium]|nr:glycosyltransferase [Bacteroidales bacterium]HOY39823.1 glycosyltransferase [Bacteroidales bacterium]HQP04857.1 glycosyltransferase [Bacteroidales bacterium]